ncbi:MAG: hypothetical protein U0270_02190 [Labilithrix sp.]
MRRALVAVAITHALACSPPPDDGMTTPVLPDRTSFPVVSQALVHRCGSIDCHGSTARNMRVWGDEAIRLSPDDTILGRPTTPAEHDANYASVVMLEPETMTDVVGDRGASPERLTLIRKAYGYDHHKGGSRASGDDPLSRCLLSWLAGATDVAACDAAARTL